ncbi:hypothetical protein GOV04_00315 [Candidatus Woesearchaeota archaeon]|nr:hypothetical protein [Candidatus Woesearchaeota archaeon]
MNQVCPKCNSDKVKTVLYQGIEVVVCTDCGYDERDDLEEAPEYRSSQREKGRYNKYKAGRPLKK